MEIIIKLLATLFDAFKAKNPIIATTIITILGLVVFNIDAIVANFGVQNAIVIDIAKFVSLFLLGVTGSRTTSILTK